MIKSLPESSNSMQITLVVNYSDKRISGGPQGVAYDTVEGLKKNHRRLEKDDIHIHIMSSLGTNFHSGFFPMMSMGISPTNISKKLSPRHSFLISIITCTWKKEKTASTCSIPTLYPGQPLGCSSKSPRSSRFMACTGENGNLSPVSIQSLRMVNSMSAGSGMSPAG